MFHIDSQGTFICTITGFLVGGIINGLTVKSKGGSFWEGAASGALTGAIAGAAADIAIATGGVGAIAIAAVGGMVSGGLNTIINGKLTNEDVSASDVVAGATIGAVANMLTFGVGGGSLAKVGGKLLSNMSKNFVSSIMKNTMKVVAGKAVYKATGTVIKNIVSNAVSEIASTTIISGGAWLASEEYEVMSK